MINPQWHGMNVNFWVGVVEQRDDSEAKDGHRLGRVRVRVLGHHSELLQEDDQSGEGIPVNKLPWAYPISPVTSASVSGIGTSPTGVVEGTWVVGISMDGPHMQDLYYLGTLPGVPVDAPNTSLGFNDPNGKYPKSDDAHARSESDLPRESRNEKQPKSVRDKKATREQSPKISAMGKTFIEPSVPYAAKYPYNHVRATESGHLEEYDDTPGKERMHWRHKDGTFTEWHEGGDEVHKVFGDGFELMLKDKNLWVKGDLNIAVDGDANIRAKNINIEAQKNIDMKAYGTIKMWSAKGIDMTTIKQLNITAMFGVKVMAGLGPLSLTSMTTLTGTAPIVGFTGVASATMGAPGNKSTLTAGSIA